MFRSALTRWPGRALALPPPPPPAGRPQRPLPRWLSSAVAAEEAPLSSEASAAEEAIEKARQLFAEYRDTQ